jgi:hypothetical protein
MKPDIEDLLAQNQLYRQKDNIFDEQNMMLKNQIVKLSTDEAKVLEEISNSEHVNHMIAETSFTILAVRNPQVGQQVGIDMQNGSYE